MSKVEIVEGAIPGGNDAQDKTKASTAITAGRLVGKDANGDVIHSLTNTEVLGLALETKAVGNTTEDPIQIAYVSKQTVLKFYVDNGTAADTHEGDLVDIHASGGVDLNVSTNDDVYVLRYLPGETSYILGTLRNTVF